MHQDSLDQALRGSQSLATCSNATANNLCICHSVPIWLFVGKIPGSTIAGSKGIPFLTWLEVSASPPQRLSHRAFRNSRWEGLLYTAVPTGFRSSFWAFDNITGKKWPWQNIFHLGFLSSKYARAYFWVILLLFLWLCLYLIKENYKATSLSLNPNSHKNMQLSLDVFTANSFLCAVPKTYSLLFCCVPLCTT